MDEQHWGSNPGSSEASKRPPSASAHKESQKEHAQKPKGTAVMASTQPQVLFGGKSAGSVHAPPLEAALTTTSNEKGGPLRPPHHNGTAQQPALQAATVHPSTAIGSPVVPTQQQIPPPPRPSGSANTSPQQPAQQQAEDEAMSAAGEGAPEVPSPQNDEPEDMWSPDYDAEHGDGTSNQVAIALSVNRFRKQAETRNASMLPKVEFDRIKTLVETKPQLKGLLPHVLWVTVLPSVELATGQQPKGRMAKHAAADPMSKNFWKDLETLLLQVAVLKKTDYEFIQTQKCHVDKNGIPTTQKFKMMFEQKACAQRIISQASKLAVFKSEYQLRFSYRLNDELPAPFPGQVYHCPLIMDPYCKQGKTPLKNGTYVDALVTGGMNTKSFTGIRRGETLRTDCDQVTKKQNFMEFYFDPTMTANHGSQELSTEKVDLMEDFNCCIPIPLHKITEPPSYVAWKDQADYIHKRELRKSGDWCPYCWGPAHELGFKCIYYNFCKYCLSFQPRDKTYKDFAMTSHLCNYDITEMPQQKQPTREKSEKLHEQVFSEERTAQVKEMEQQAEAIKAKAALILKQKLKRKREQKLAEQKKKVKKKEKKVFTSQNWRN